MPVYIYQDQQVFVEVLDTQPIDTDMYTEPGVTKYYFVINNGNRSFVVNSTNSTVLAAATKRIHQLFPSQQCTLNGSELTSKAPIDELREVPLNIAWTGGWDSTFRVCHAALIEKRLVQPHYVRFTTRRCSSKLHIFIEEQIIKLLYQELLNLGASVLEPKFYTDTDFVESSDVVYSLYEKYLPPEPYESSPQYFMLTLFAQHYDISGLEISVESNLDRPSYQTDYILQHCKYHGTGHYCRQKDDVLGMHSDFRFPVSHLTKKKMGDIAATAEPAFGNILQSVWSCMNPMYLQDAEDTNTGFLVCCRDNCSCCKEISENGQEERLELSIPVTGFTLDFFMQSWDPSHM